MFYIFILLNQSRSDNPKKIAAGDRLCANCAISFYKNPMLDVCHKIVKNSNICHFGKSFFVYYLMRMCINISWSLSNLSRTEQSHNLKLSTFQFWEAVSTLFIILYILLVKALVPKLV